MQSALIRHLVRGGVWPRAAALLLVAALLAGCSTSAWRKEQVDVRVAEERERWLSCPADAVGRCSENSPLLALGRASAASGTHRVTLLETGLDALTIRIHLARAARERIDLQSFILRPDDSGELLLHEMLNAARRGVRIRMLIDQMFTSADLERLVALTLAHENFEIRFHNPSFHKARTDKHDWISGVACCFRRFNERMHNKLLVVDGQVGLIGGRNIADRYFDFDPNYNFKDRDVAVFGPEVDEMAHSFEVFWNSPDSIRLQHLRDVARVLLERPAPEVVPYVAPDRFGPLLASLEDERDIQSRFVDPAFEVERLDYFWDPPRKAADPPVSTRQDITGELHRLFSGARQSIVIQSPYMVLSREARNVFESLQRNHPQIVIVFSTNSLASTDADTVYAHTNKHKKRYVQDLGFRMYEFKPFPADAPEFFPRWPQLMEEKKAGLSSRHSPPEDDSLVSMPAPRAGLHSKSFVIDQYIGMIGSHNFDPRSEGLNTENGIIVWDDGFARALEDLIRRDIEPQNSWVVAMKPPKGTAEPQVEHRFDTRPEFGFWSDGPTSAYEIVPGAEPVPPDSPDFYRNYYPVGSFPEVIRTRRQVMVLFLGSFFGFLEPIL